MTTDPNNAPDTARTRRDAAGRLRHLDHSTEPYRPTGLRASAKPLGIATRYVRQVLGIEQVSARRRPPTDESRIQLTPVGQKRVGNLATVEFEQRCQGLPVWRSGVTVTVDRRSGRVMTGRSTYDHDLSRVAVDRELLDQTARAIDRELLFEALALGKNLRRARQIEPDANLSDLAVEITATRPLIYRYRGADRQEPEPRSQERRFLGELPRLALPKVDDRIEEGCHYAVVEVLFTITSPWGDLNWRAFLEPETRSVLYLRPLVAHLAGLVFDHDPLTATGDTTITPGSATAVLNALRTPRPLPGLVPSAPQALAGEYVTVQDVLAPAVAPPTVTAGDFDYDADTDDFAAVNAYYHSDAVFRMVAEMGFDMATYFDGTSFPVPVDHRGKCGLVNAKAPGNALGNGSDGFRYGLVEVEQPVGIATDLRIVLHEFGHAILWDNVHSPNFGFAHSPGDSLAAILCDPGSRALDRFETFPWLTQSNPTIDRRHDRDPAAGWAWGGTEDDGGYGSEQILCTSHFRAYLALGGSSDDPCEREFAARYLVYLILCGVGILTPVTNSNSPEDWVAELISCDLSSESFEGHPGSAVHKVLRWAFVLQGAFQPPGAPSPVVGPGAPPAVDVYINDGRNGEYGYSDDTYRTTEIWNRRQADGGAAHQRPIPGIPNYAYVVVRNRGTEPARRVRVRGFHRVDCRCGTCCCERIGDWIWPNDFKPMVTVSLTVPQVAPGGYAVVGPFEWLPGEREALLFAVDAVGDRSNIGVIPASATVPVRHFVPFDNNLAARRLCHLC